MEIEFVARHVEIDGAARKLFEERLRRAVRFLREPVEARLAFEGGAGEKHLFTVEAHVTHARGALHAHAEGPEVREVALDAISGIEAQSRREHEKPVDKRRRATREAIALRQWPVEVLSRDSIRSGEAPRVVRSTMIDIKPMTIDEAALKLETSRNEFVVFVDAESERVSVLYKRKDEDYGLIAPEL